MSTHRNWMYEMKNSIGPYRLSEIILPGSHKSGLYIKNLPIWETPYEKYTVTQVSNICVNNFSKIYFHIFFNEENFHPEII